MSEDEIAKVNLRKPVERVVAWTGGSKPPQWIKGHRSFRRLRSRLFREQVAVSPLDLWACAGTSALERARIFWNRATYDSWATYRGKSTI